MFIALTWSFARFWVETTIEGFEDDMEEDKDYEEVEVRGFYRLVHFQPRKNTFAVMTVHNRFADSTSTTFTRSNIPQRLKESPNESGSATPRAPSKPLAEQNVYERFHHFSRFSLTYLSSQVLQAQGINMGDINKLKSVGVCTVQRCAASTPLRPPVICNV